MLNNYARLSEPLLKRIFFSGLLLGLFVLLSVRSTAQITVNATGGTLTQSYTDIKLAFDAINIGTHTGTITIDVTANASTTFTSAVLNSSNTGGASYTSLTIRPTADGVTIQGAAATGRGVIELNGADNVTINGDNAGTGGVNRNLSVINTATAATTFGAVIRVATTNVADYNTNSGINISNCILTGNVTGGNAAATTGTGTSANSSFGVVVGPNGGASVTALASVTTGMSTTAPAPTVDNFTVNNCLISQCGRGVAFLGGNAASSNNVTITNNEIGNSTAATPAIAPFTAPTSTVYAKGIYVQNLTSLTVTGNTLYNIMSYLGIGISAIETAATAGTTGGSINVNQNTITNVSYNGTGGFAATGILFASAVAPFNINQNTITGIHGLGTSSISAINLSGGITATAGTIAGNNIATVYERNTGGYGAFGIRVLSGSNITVQNNFIRDLLAVNVNSNTTTAFGIHGITFTAGTGHKVYNNSVHLTGAWFGASLTADVSAALTISSTTITGMDVRNNIFSNVVTGAANTVNACVQIPSGATSAMNLTFNNNAYYAGAAANQYVGILTATFTGYTAANFNPGTTAPATNMRAYTSTLLTGGTNDNSSFASTSAAPFTSATNLHIPAATSGQLESGGASVGLTTDIDGNVRPGPAGSVNGGAVASDIGADEFDGVMPNCSGTPTLGTPSPTTVATCGVGELVPPLTYTGGSAINFSGLTYQWEESDDNGGGDPWSNAVGGTGSGSLTYTPPVYSANIFYRLVRGCSFGSSANGTSIGVASLAAPSTQASNITSGTITASSIVVNFTAGNGGGRAVYINNTNSFTAPPGPASPGTPNTVWQAGGQQLVMLSGASTVTVTGLVSGATYFFRVYDYNSCIAAGPVTNYSFNSATAANNPNSFSTTTTVANSYAFSQSSGTYTTLTGGTSLQAGTGFDDGTVNVTFPFTFNYNGAAYTTGKTGTNGFLSFGTTYTGDGRNAITSADGQLVTALSLDLGSGATGYLLSEHILGSAPFRQYVLQWKNVSELANGDDYNFQIILNEANGDVTQQSVQIVYGAFTTAVAPTITPAVGIKGGSASNFSSRTISTGTGFTTGTFNWANSATGITSGATMSVNTLLGYGPASGLTFTWTPTPACSGTPSAAGTPVLTNINACAGSAAVPGVLYVSGETQAPGIGYQWMVASTSGGALSNATGGSNATTPQYTLPNPIVSTGYYKLRVDCGGSSIYSAEIVVGSITPVTQTTAVAGTGTCAGTGITANWTSGSGSNRAVYINDVNTWSNPTNGVALPAANTVYGGTGQQLVAISGTNVTVTGLTPGNTYYFRVYEFNCTASPLFNTTNNAVAIVNAVAAPSVQTTNIVSTTTTPSSIAISMTAGSGVNGRVVYVNTSNSFTAPLDGTSPTAATLYAGGQQCVLNGAGTTVTVTGLNPNTTYWFRSYEVNCTGASTMYNTSTATGNPASITTKAFATYSPTFSTGLTYTAVTGGTQLWASGGGNFDDSNSGSLVFPFPFTYRGETVNAFNVNVNGFVSLGTPSQAPVTTGLNYINNLAGATTGFIFIAPFWEDLYVNGAGVAQRIAYEVTGTTPNRVLTVDWTNVELFQYPGPALNFQVKFYEVDSRIEYVYGNMQGFDGTLGNYNAVNGLTFTYSIGLTSGYTLSTPAIAGEVMGLQQTGSNLWTHQGFQSANLGNNALSFMPECNTGYTFAPSGSVYAQDAAPSIPAAPANDEPLNAIVLSVPLTPPADFCGNLFTSQSATATPGYSNGTCPTVNGDDDVWFKFQANSTATTIDLRGSGGYDAVIQVFDGGTDPDAVAPVSTTPISCVNATNMGGAAYSNGLTETFTAANAPTIVGRYYYVRVFHAGGGTQAVYTANVSAGSVTGFTSVTNGTGYITSSGGLLATGYPRVYITGTNTQGVKVEPTVAGGAITALNLVGGQNGYGQISGPVTVTIVPSSAGLTGAFAMNVFATPTPPANDEIAASVNAPFALTSALTCTNVSATTLNATQSLQPVGCGNPDDDVWFSFVAATPADVITVDPSGPNFNPAVEVFSSSNNLPGGTLTSLGCQNTNGNGVNEVYTTSGLTAGNTYFVRVFSNSFGTLFTGNFDICVTGVAPTCPTLNSPANAGTVATTTVPLSWTAVANATTYDVFLDQNPTPTTLVSNDQAGTTYNGTITAGTWYWRIVANNALGSSTSCTIRSFSTAAPGCPTLTSPANAASIYYVTGTNLSWTAPVSGASSYDVYMDQNPSPTTLVANDLNALTYVTGALLQNVTYYWRVEANGDFGSSSGCTTRNFITNAPAPPVNDEPCNATPLTVGSVCSFTNSSNLNASTTAGVPAPGCASFLGSDVWFTVTVPANGKLDFTTLSGTVTDGGMAIYSATGTCPSLTFTLIECDDDDAPDGSLMPYISRTGLTPGSTIYIRFWEFSNDNNGTFGISVSSPTTAANDDFCSATTLVVGNGCAPVTGNTSGATASVGVTAPSCGTPGNDIWYKFVVPASGHVIINTQIDNGCQALGDGVMALYSATGTCPSLTFTQVACNDDGGPGLLPAIEETSLTPGQTLYIRFWGFNNSNGAFGLCIIDGSATPPANDVPGGAINAPVSGNAYPSCGALYGDCSIASDSPEDTGAGHDLWYRFTAQSSAVRIRLISGGMNGSIQLFDNALTAMAGGYENAVGTVGGTEILNYIGGGFTAGQQYYVCVGSEDANTGAPFSLCIQNLMPSTCADGPGTYDLCTNFKPVYTGANSYQMSFTQTAPSAGPTTVASSPSQLALSSTGLNLRHGYTYSVSMATTYNLVNGAGTPEQIIVPGTSTCSITIAPHADLRTKSTQRCPATVLKGTTLQAKPFICAADYHVITFHEVADCSGTEIGGVTFSSNSAGSSPTKSLASIGGVQSGHWYEVTWTPHFNYGLGTPGTTDIIYVAGSVQPELLTDELANQSRSEESVIEASLYPNPNNGELVNLNITNVQSDNVFVRIFDNMGRVVYTNRFTVDGSLNTNVSFTKPLANGLYMVEFTVDGNVTTERMIVSK